MDRNLSRRVEAVAPVEVRHLRERIWDVLQVELSDERNAWQMQSDGTYVQLRPTSRASRVARDGTHVTLMKRARTRARSKR
jgi:polyphosphate kinase